MLTPYYQTPQATIYHGDCRDLLPLLSADVLVTDPPYGVHLGKHHGEEECRKGDLVKSAYASYDDTPENFAEVVLPALRTALAVTDRGVVFAADRMLWDLPRGAAVGGVFLPSACGRGRWGYASMAFVVFYGGAPDLHKGAKATAIRSTERSYVDGHPCPKPLGWMVWAVALASRAGETILDPFMGSGTTLVAAKQLGRRAIGIEMEERYCEIAAKRLAQEVLDFGAVEQPKAEQGALL